MKNTDRKRLYEVMNRLDKTFKRKLNESRQKTFTLNLFGDDEEVFLELNRYRNGNALSVEMMLTDGEPYAVISTNLKESAELPEDEFYLKDWSENEPIADELIKMGIIIPTGKSASTGFVVAKSYKVNPEYK